MLLGRSSFLKKRSKKLLDVLVAAFPDEAGQTRKSFLVLFFKKEHLPFLAQLRRTPFV
jgi:hypothetical protein